MYTDWLSTRANVSPNDRAVHDLQTQRNYTYKELNQRAQKMAVYLTEYGVSKGDRVALYSSNNIAHFDLFFACTKIGAIFIPLNWRLKSNELEDIIEDADPTFIAYSNFKLERLEKIQDQLNLCVDSEEYENIFFDTAIKSFSHIEVTKEDPAVLIYTSGTTGSPKGAIIPHRAVITNGLFTIASWALTDKDSTITFPPMFHTAGLFCLVIPILIAGGEVVLKNVFDKETIIEEINQFKPTMLFLVPTMYYDMIHTDDFESGNFDSVRLFISGGAPVSKKVLNTFRKYKLPLVDSYGLTEVGPNNFMMDPEETWKHEGSVGKPMLFNEMRIMKNDEEQAQVNEIGELWIKGDHAFDGYWNNYEETAKTFHRSFVKTGDLARKDEEGYYYIAGRRKELIITGGENVLPSEVEQVINQHKAINDSVVVGYPNERWGESVGAAVILNENYPITEEVLDRFVTERLAGYKTPKSYVFVDEYPKTSVGKIDKQKISDMIIERLETKIK